MQIKLSGNFQWLEKVAEIFSNARSKKVTNTWVIWSTYLIGVKPINVSGTQNRATRDGQ